LLWPPQLLDATGFHFGFQIEISDHETAAYATCVSERTPQQEGHRGCWRKTGRETNLATRGSVEQIRQRRTERHRLVLVAGRREASGREGRWSPQSKFCQKRWRWSRRRECWTWRRGSLFNRGTWPADVSETAKQLVRHVITNALLLACPRCPAPSSPSAPQCQRPRRPRAACNKASEPASSAPPAEEVAMSSAQPFGRH
jgi:hypothetical protein